MLRNRGYLDNGDEVWADANGAKWLIGSQTFKDIPYVNSVACKHPFTAKDYKGTE